MTAIKIILDARGKYQATYCRPPVITWPTEKIFISGKNTNAGKKLLTSD